MTTAKCPETRNDGYILFAVLSVTALLAGLLISLSLVSRSAISSASIAESSVALDAVTRSGLELAGFQLFALRLPVTSVDGQTLRFNGGTARLLVAPESGKVDLNGSNEILLAAAYRAGRIGTLSPESFAARVADWRDLDDDMRDDGAEAADYAASGLAYGPDNAPFASVDALVFIPGISPADIERLRPFLTVFNGKGLLDPHAIAPELLRALPGMSEQSVAAVLAGRGRRDEDSDRALNELLAGQAELVTFDRPAAYRVNIEARSDRFARTSTAIFTIIESTVPANAYQVVGWEE